MDYGNFLYHTFLALWLMAAWKDFESRKVSKFLVLFILANAFLIFIWNIGSYTNTDYMVIFVNLLITGALVLSGKMGKADIILVTLPVAFPFYGVLALVLFSVALLGEAVFEIVFESEFLMKAELTKTVKPVITIVFMLFLLSYVAWTYDSNVPQSICDKVGDKDCNLIIYTTVIEDEGYVNGGGVGYSIEPYP